MRLSVRCHVICMPLGLTLRSPVDPDGQLREADGKRVSQSVLDAMAAKEIHAMRLGPGKHLKGRVLFDGLVQPEEVRLSLHLENLREEFDRLTDFLPYTARA